LEKDLRKFSISFLKRTAVLLVSFLLKKLERAPTLGEMDI
jgi:hypothetical protein